MEFSVVDRNAVLSRMDEQHEMMEDKIRLGIEANRKGFAKLKFMDRDGKPLSNVKVLIKQTNSDAISSNTNALPPRKKTHCTRSVSKSSLIWRSFRFIGKTLNPRTDKCGLKKTACSLTAVRRRSFVWNFAAKTA